MNPWIQGLQMWNADAKKGRLSSFVIPKKGTPGYARVMALRGERRAPKELMADMMNRPVLKNPPGDRIYADF